MSAAPLLTVDGLTIDVDSRRGAIRVVDGVDLALAPGEVLGIVGESGSGKTLTALGLAGLLPHGATRAAGAVRLLETDLAALPPADLRHWHGRRIGFIFQDPAGSLNPVMTISAQLAEPLRRHLRLGRAAARAEAGRLLRLVDLPGGADRLDDYPHQLSGGMQQRVMIAIAIACAPALLIADEPTTALDVTTQAQIVGLVRRLVADLGLSVLWISHDLALVSQIASRIAVFYAGRVVEEGDTAAVVASPRHPYTRGLIAAHAGALDAAGRLATIPGAAPDPAARPTGCAFAPRCDRADAGCRATQPSLDRIGGRRVACFHPLPEARA